MSAVISRDIPVKPSWPLIGDSLDMIRDGHAYIFAGYRRYGEVFSTSAFGIHFTFLLGPDANQFVFQNRGDLFANRQWEYFIGPFFHRGLMLLDFDEHRMHRRIMQSAFHHDALVRYLELMQPRIESGLNTWQPRDGFLMFDHLKALTLDVGSQVFVGQPPGEEAAQLNEAFLATVRAGTGVIRRPWPGTRWKAGVEGRKVLEAFFRREIGRKRATLSDDLFSRLCHATNEEGQPFDDDDVVNHMIFVLMAAHDTSTITLTNMIYHLARHPDWQDRLRAESSALGKAELGFEDLEKLAGMSLVMKEALRMCAPVPGLPRIATQDFEFKGFQISAGTKISISPWLTHYLPEYWTEPERFDPERFSEARAEDKRHPFLWVPFGGGAHKCIGMHFGQMEIKSILHRMLLKFRWGVPARYEMQQDFTSLPIPKDRLPVRLERI
jgi:cytochrome P450